MSKKIKWQYTHNLNNRSSVERAKKGVYYGKVKHTYKHWRNPGAVQMAVVRFDGNKRSSQVPFDELIFL